MTDAAPEPKKVGLMRQVAPYPTALEELVDQTAYRPEWRVTLEDRDRGQGSEGLTLCIWTVGYDTYNPDKGQTYRVVHYFIVPAAAYDRRAWQRPSGGVMPVLEKTPETPAAQAPEADDEHVTLVAIRTKREPDLVDLAEALRGLEFLGPDGDHYVTMLARKYADTTANDNGHLRELGFDFLEANLIFTVAWQDGET